MDEHRQRQSSMKICGACQEQAFAGCVWKEGREGGPGVARRGG